VAYNVGDEEIELYMGEGDGYELTSEVQDHYEHCLPKRKEVSERRMCMIFRHGRRRSVERDSGKPCDPAEWRRFGLHEAGDVSDCLTALVDEVAQQCEQGPQDILKGAEGRCGVNFGHPTEISGITEGSLTSRTEVYQTFAHNSDQRGVSGNLVAGADAVVVARVDGNVRERDGLSWLRYTSMRKQGGGAMAVSFKNGSPIRVFRSSSASDTKFRPVIHERSSGHQAAVLRYDGIYKIVRMIDNEGQDTVELPPPEQGEEKPQWTFFLIRAPTIDEFDGRGQWKDWKLEYCNHMPLKDLWQRIQALNRIPEQDITEVVPHVKEEVNMVMQSDASAVRAISACVNDLVNAAIGKPSNAGKVYNHEVYSQAWLKEKKQEWGYERSEKRIARTVNRQWVRPVVSCCLANMCMELERRELDVRDCVETVLSDAVDEVVIRSTTMVQDKETEFGSCFGTWLKTRKTEWRKARLSSLLREFDGVMVEDEEQEYGFVESFPFVANVGGGSFCEDKKRDKPLIVRTPYRNLTGSYAAPSRPVTDPFSREYTIMKNSIIAEKLKSTDPLLACTVSVSVKGKLLEGVLPCSTAWSRIRGSKLVTVEKLKLAMREWQRKFLERGEHQQHWARYYIYIYMHITQPSSRSILTHHHNFLPPTRSACCS
jgi:hypothetical protein